MASHGNFIHANMLKYTLQLSGNQTSGHVWLLQLLSYLGINVSLQTSTVPRCLENYMVLGLLGVTVQWECPYFLWSCTTHSLAGLRFQLFAAGRFGGKLLQILFLLKIQNRLKQLQSLQKYISKSPIIRSSKSISPVTFRWASTQEERYIFFHMKLIFPTRHYTRKFRDTVGLTVSNFFLKLTVHLHWREVKEKKKKKHVYSVISRIF